MSAGNSRRKVRAVLAGGLVLGVGAVVTLASWNDSEFVTGTFQAGSFNLEGSAEGPTGEFADHASEGEAAQLEFTLPLAQNLSPGDVVAAPFWVRLDETTTSPATLVATNVEADGENSDHLSYEITSIGSEDTCAGDVVGTVLASGASLDDINSGDDIDLEVGGDGEAGESLQLCVVVTAGDGLIQGDEASATWQFTATSE